MTASKTLKHMEADLFPAIGHRPVSEITPPELLSTLRKVEARGAIYTATRLREICGQVFRFAIATGRATYNPAADLTGAIVPLRSSTGPPSPIDAGLGSSCAICGPTPRLTH